MTCFKKGDCQAVMRGICTTCITQSPCMKRGEKRTWDWGRQWQRLHYHSACGSVHGEKLAPYVVYKGRGNLMASHTQNGPPGTDYSLHVRFWMDGDVQLPWVVSQGLPQCSGWYVAYWSFFLMDTQSLYTSLPCSALYTSMIMDRRLQWLGHLGGAWTVRGCQR